MAKNQKNQSAAIRFCPAVGYVWQKGQIYQLGQQITACESRLVLLRDENQKLGDQLAVLRSPVMLDQRVRELNLGLVPAKPAQIYRLVESPPNENSRRQFAARQNSGTIQ
jgi:hypothetical protein